MLQLVVEIGNTQALILPATSHIESSQVDDKLKHVGHSPSTGHEEIRRGRISC